VTKYLPIAAFAALALAGPALALTPEEEARFAALESRVSSLEAEVEGLSDTLGKVVDLLIRIPPALVAIDRDAGAGAHLARCIKAAERVAYRGGAIRMLPDWPNVRGSFFIPVVHPACVRPSRPHARAATKALAGFAERFAR